MKIRPNKSVQPLVALRATVADLKHSMKEVKNMKRLVAILLFAATATMGYARDFSYADATPFLGLEQVAKGVKKAVFAVQIEGNNQGQEKGNDWLILGTGFFVTGTNGVILGVTCNHVIAGPIGANKQVFVGIETEKGYKRAFCKIVLQDQPNDIAILAPQRRTDDNPQFQNVTFPDALFDDNSSLVEGRGVVIPGYPLALGNEDDRNNPVVRIGIIAQFTGKNYFLIDGVASHGNSGSPVFALNYNNHKLVGMITSHVTDRISLIDENAQIAAHLPYNSGLARAVSMKVIAEVLQRAIGKY